MAPPLWGFVPLKSPKVDRRWLDANDTSGVDKSFAPPIAQSADSWANGAVRYQPDAGDTWTKAAETLARGYGDCEDIALVKRAVLRNSGIPESHIFFLLVRDLISRSDHAVIVVFDQIWRLLDTFNSLSLPVERVKDYMPVLAYSGSSCWLYGRRVK